MEKPNDKKFNELTKAPVDGGGGSNTNGGTNEGASSGTRPPRVNVVKRNLFQRIIDFFKNIFK